MGYVIDDHIIVTGCPTSYDPKQPSLSQCRDKARELGLDTTEIVIHNINDLATFLIVTDGSKEGWPDSERADAARTTWFGWFASNYPWGIRYIHVRRTEEGDIEVNQSKRHEESDE